MVHIYVGRLRHTWLRGLVLLVVNSAQLLLIEPALKAFSQNMNIAVNTEFSCYLLLITS